MPSLTWVLSSCVLILVVIALRAVFGKKINLTTRYMLWGVVLLRLLLPFEIGGSAWSVASAVEGANLPETSETVVAYRNINVSPDLSIPEPDLSLPAEERQAQYEINRAAWEAQMAEPRTVEATPVTVADILKWVWYMGIAVTAAIFLVSNLRFYFQLRKRRVPLETDCKLKVYAVENLSSSCLFLNSVYVSAETAEDALKLRHVLAHEAAHFRHGDGVWALLRCVALALHWYNPLVWWAAALSRRDSELFADEGALRRLGEDERESYGVTLITLSARHPAGASLLCTATTMAGGKRALKERVVMIAKGKPRAALWAVLIVGAVAALAVGGTLVGAKAETSEADAVPLTQAQIDRANEALSSLVTLADGSIGTSEISCFFTSCYDSPEEIDLRAFLRYAPISLSTELTDDDMDEFLTLTAPLDWVTASRPSEMPVPIRRYAEDTVNSVLMKYANVTLDDLTDKGDKYEAFYLPEYHAYYTFTSDFGPGVFQCAGGEVLGDTVRLWSAPSGEDGSVAVLTLENVNGTYYIRSFTQEGTAAEAADTPVPGSDVVLPITIGQGPAEVVSRADLDRDGRDEDIVVTEQLDGDTGQTLGAAIAVVRDDGTELWYGALSTAHAGWGSIFKYVSPDDGTDHLLYYQPNYSTGNGVYEYKLFDLARSVTTGNFIEFCTGPLGALDLDGEAMAAFAEEINALLAQSTLIASTDGGTLKIGPGAAEPYYENYSAFLDGTPFAYPDGMTLAEKIEYYESMLRASSSATAGPDDFIEDIPSFLSYIQSYGFNWHTAIYEDADAAMALIGKLYDYVLYHELTDGALNALLQNTYGLDGAYAEGYQEVLQILFARDAQSYLRHWADLDAEAQIRALPGVATASVGYAGAEAARAWMYGRLEEYDQGTVSGTLFTYGDLQITVSDVVGTSTGVALFDSVVESWEYAVYTCAPGAVAKVVYADMVNIDGQAYPKWAFYTEDAVSVAERTDITYGMPSVPVRETLYVCNTESGFPVLKLEVSDG